MERRLLIAAAALAAMSIPSAAQAQRWSDADFGAAANVTVHRGKVLIADTGRDRHDFRDRHRRHDGRRHRDGDDALVGGFWGYEADYDINRGWDSDSFNDWWHDRPDRAFPRWVQNNQNCTADRMWWSGNGWHC
jgi:hypothetical protein